MANLDHYQEHASPGLGDPYRRLMGAVLVEASIAARAGDGGAAAWLASESAWQFCDVVGLDHFAISRQAQTWRNRARGRIVLVLE